MYPGEGAHVDVVQEDGDHRAQELRKRQRLSAALTLHGGLTARRLGTGRLGAGRAGGSGGEVRSRRPREGLGWGPGEGPNPARCKQEGTQV